MKRALVVVDVQNDFVDGSLAVPGGAEVIAPIGKLAASGDYSLVAATRDWHPADHISFDPEPKYEDGSWPAHCVQGTLGADLHVDIRPLTTHIFSKGDAPGAEEYSGAHARVPNGTTLTEMLKKEGVEEVDVVGLALDYCVRDTALDLQAGGFPVRVPLATTRAVTPETGAAAIKALRDAGVEVTE